MDKLDNIFDELEVGEMSELLENIEVEKDAALSARIKGKAMAQIFPEVITKKKKTKNMSLLKIIPMAAALVFVIAAAVIGVSHFTTPQKQPQTTTAPTTTARFENPLLLAISSGNEGLIESLLKNSILISEEVLSFAIDCIDIISYKSIRDIASAVKERFGTTGLDALLESTILGDSKRALEELRKRENMLMTPGEKLAFFFSAAFCDSEVIKAFREKGFDFGLTDSTGRSVYEIAEKYGNGENIKNAEENSEN